MKKKMVRNMRELTLMKQKLNYQQKLYEKEINASTADLIDNLTDKLKEAAFDIASRLLIQIIKSKRKAHRENKSEEAK
jgi:hypothetical protein